MANASLPVPLLQNSGMLSREQLVHLFHRFSFLTSQPDAKQRIQDAVKNKQEPVSVTTAIQEEIFLELGIDAKQRIQDAVKNKQEPVSVTTAIQEEIFLELGIDPSFGIACLQKVSSTYESDMDLMIQFYKFVSKEEMACDEAELAAEEFSEKLHAQQQLQDQQLEMLKNIRKFQPDVQSAILETLRKQMENAGFDSSVAVMTSEQIQEIVSKTLPTI